MILTLLVIVAAVLTLAYYASSQSSSTPSSFSMSSLSPFSGTAPTPAPDTTPPGDVPVEPPTSTLDAAMASIADQGRPQVEMMCGGQLNNTLVTGVTRKQFLVIGSGAAPPGLGLTQAQQNEACRKHQDGGAPPLIGDASW